MPLYRFRITFEDYEFVSREIDIRTDQTFEDFFFALQHSIGFDNTQPASFYMSNDQWTLGQELTNLNNKKNALSMQNEKLVDWINDPHQKIYYIYGADGKWTFYIELVKIIMKEDPSKNYPYCSKASGESPKQYIRHPTAAKGNAGLLFDLPDDLLAGAEAKPADNPNEGYDDDERSLFTSMDQDEDEEQEFDEESMSDDENPDPEDFENNRQDY
jgi:hypothetical protein